MALRTRLRLRVMGGDSGPLLDASDFDGGTIKLYSGAASDDAGDELASGTLPDHPFENLDGGDRDKRGVWAMTATKNGTARGLFLSNAGGDIKTWFTVTESGGGGDIIIDNDDVQIGDVIAIATLLWTLEGDSLVVTGTVVDGSAAAVAGGTVQLIDDTDTVVDTDTPDGSGAFSLTAAEPGTHTVKHQPPLTHCLGPSEPDDHTVNVNGGQSPVAIVLQSAIYSDDFQSYDSTTLKAGFGQGVNISLGNFGYTPTHVMDIGSLSNGSNITMIPDDGFGKKAMQYAWPARPGDASEITISIQPRLNPPPVLTNLRVRFTTLESAVFEAGLPSLGSGQSYKFFLINFENGGLGKQGRLGAYFGYPGSGGANRITLSSDMTDAVHTVQLLAPAAPVIGDPNWGGSYHTWILEALGIGTASCVFNIYLDGVLQSSISEQFFPGVSVGGSGWAVTLEMGANMNNGPEDAQTRWWRELGVYTARPSFISMTP